MDRRPAALVDFDGTLSLRGSRSPYDYSTVSEDLPNSPVISVVRALREFGLEIVVISGREDVCDKASRQWLATHLNFPIELFLRQSGDYRPDYQIKEEIYRKFIEPNWQVELALDDRQQCVDLWRQLGIVTLQVAPGNF